MQNNLLERIWRGLPVLINARPTSKFKQVNQVLVRFLVVLLFLFCLFFKSGISTWITNFEQSGLDTQFMSLFISWLAGTQSEYRKKQTKKTLEFRIFIHFCSDFTILNRITYYQGSYLEEYLSAMLSSFTRSNHGHLHVNHFFFQKIIFL